METGVVVRWVRPGAVRWSEDNQLFVLSSDGVHILTPTFDTKGEDGPGITFLKTSVVSLDEKDPLPWTLAQDVRAIRRSATQKAPEYIAAAWSPTHCSPTGGCILACLDTRGSVTLHVPETSPTKYLTLDAHVLKLWKAPKKDLQTKMADMVETVSIAWSPRTGALGAGGSLLTLGNQAGYITLWNIVDPTNIRHLKTLQIAGENVWITQLSWSPWFVENGNNASYLACGLSNGRISVLKALRTSTDRATTLDDISFSEDLFKDNRFDLSQCTGFAWSYQEPQMATKGGKLCIAKGNRVYIWNPETDTMASWRRRATFPITHIQWSNGNTKIIAMFYDGKAFALDFKDDKLEESPSDSSDSTFLSQNVIGRCHHQTNGTKDDDDEKGGKDGDAGDDGDEDEGDTAGSAHLRILSGDSSPDGYCTAFVYFFQNPGAVKQKQNAVLLLTASRSDPPTSDDTPVFDHILSDLEELLKTPSLALAKNPSHYLWNTLFYITNLNNSQLEKLHVADKLLRVFDDSSQMEVDTPRTQVEHPNQAGFSVEDKLLYAMYHDAAISSERAIFYLWTHLKPLSLPEPFKKRLEERAVKSTARIRAHVTGLILDQFAQQVSEARPVKDISEGDQTMLLLLCDSVVRMVQSRSPQVALSLTVLAQHAAKVYRMIQEALPRYNDLDQPLQVLENFIQGRDATSDRPTAGLESKREVCPACDAPVAFEDESTAVCDMGHVFGRCSTTLQITSWSLLVCNGCGLKVASPSSDSNSNNNSSSSSGNVSWMDTILHASPLCVFCLELRQSILI
ncbi:hypothetical protein DFQ26_004450 [Actinomortierella ambigua]|nr:hypothetical protein DFQ26_004450 [Actinomortierella ambigua]